MSKRDVLFLFGEYRTFDLVHEFYVKNIPDNVDVYISTWNKSLEKKKGYIKLTKNNKVSKLDWFKIPYSQSKRFAGKRESSTLVHRIDNVNKDVFESIFRKKLKGISIANIEWNQFLDSADDRLNYTDSKFLGGTSSMIYHWKKLVSMVEEQNHTYDRVIAMRLDSIPQFKLEPFTYSFPLDEDTLYTSSIEDMDNWTFFNDTHFMGKFKAIKTWVDNLDMKRDYKTHSGIAAATGKMVNEGILKHKGLSGELGSIIVRRSMIPLIEDLLTTLPHKKVIPIIESFLMNLSEEQQNIIHESNYE